MDDESRAILLDMNGRLGRIEGALGGANGGGIAAEVRRLRDDFDNRAPLPEKCPGIQGLRDTLKESRQNPRERLRTAGVYVAILVNIGITVLALVQKGVKP